MNEPGHEAAAALARGAALAQLEESVGGRERVAELIGDFLASLPAQLDELHTAISLNDLDRVHGIAHALKSSAASFGAVDFALACGLLEQAARVANREELLDLVARVEAEAARSAPGLAAARDGFWTLET